MVINCFSKEIRIGFLLFLQSGHWDDVAEHLSRNVMIVDLSIVNQGLCELFGVVKVGGVENFADASVEVLGELFTVVAGS